MTVRLRRAGLGDIDGIVALKQSLRIAPGRAANRGGFLLGCSRDRYAFLIGAAHVTLLQVSGRVAGFAVTLPDPVLRASDLWVRRKIIGWYPGEGEPAESERIAYFDQLALAPGTSRLHAAPLALAAVHRLKEARHDHLYATTLASPVCNGASLPLLRAFGTRIVGEVRERYDGLGEVVSWLHHAPMAGGLAAVAACSIGLRATLAAGRLAA